MNNKISWGIIILSLIYVPAQYCYPRGCSQAGHKFLFDLGRNEVSITRLIIQVIVAIIIALVIEKYSKK